MELYLYKGEFNIPSIDFDCLRVVVSYILRILFKSFIYFIFLRHLSDFCVIT